MKRFNICLVRWDLRMLPQAATCFNALNIPAYTSFAMMKARLEYAADNAVGFGYK